MVQLVGGDYDGSANLEQAPSIVFDAPFNYSSFPVVQLESPQPDATYAGILTVQGIAYDPNDRISRLDILVDGVPRRLILPTVSRQDFCSSQPVRNCPSVGFSTVMDLNTLGIAAGSHTIQIRAANSRGAWKNFPDQPVALTVTAGQSRSPVGAIETPVSGTTLTGSTTVRGYVYATDIRIVAVDVLVDGTTYGAAVYGVRRDDICGTLNPRPVNCPNVGFSFSLNPTSGMALLSNGTHALQVRARDESGRLTLISDTAVSIVVNNPSNVAPQGVLLNPAPNQTVSGTIKIWGWAWDPDGIVQQVRLLIDGFNLQVLSYGDERSEQCATLPDVKACPNIGFWGDFDTSAISNGTHQIGVQIIDSAGNAVVIPRLSSDGMKITVRN